MNNFDAIIHDLEIMNSAINYRQWIYSQFSKHIGKRIVEIGSGIGNFTGLLLDRDLVVAIDNYEACVEYLKNRYHNYKNVVPLKMDISNPEILNISNYNFDTVICINVLEHVKDDVAALSNMFKILPPGGKLALLVPAFDCLYGSIDRLVGHYRRYRKKDIREKLDRVGFKINDMMYMNSIAVIGWFLNNRILRRREESPKQVMFYDKYIINWLRSIESVIRPPFGLSLITIAEKK